MQNGGLPTNYQKEVQLVGCAAQLDTLSCSMENVVLNVGNP